MDEQFTATLQKSRAKGGWTYVVWPVTRSPYGCGRGSRADRTG